MDVAGVAWRCDVLRLFLSIRMALFLRPLEPDSGSGVLRIPADAEVLRVGRDASSDLRVDDISVSSPHAMIEGDGGGRFEVVDCGSSNGTFVNGLRVDRHPLAEGDLLRFAAVEFRVEGAESASEPPESGPREQADSVRRLQRDLEEAAGREERLSFALSEARRETMERDGVIAALRYDYGALEGRLARTEAERARLEAVSAELEGNLNEARERLGATVSALDGARGERDAADAAREELLGRLGAFGERILADWAAWFDEVGLPGGGGSGREEGIFARAEAVAARIRSELDRIEPIWLEFGGGVQDELRRRCEVLRAEEGELLRDLAWHRLELERLKGELAAFREFLEAEVRRAQGLSRRGVEVEIPARLEAMVVAKDHELELYRSLLERMEVLDRLIAGYARSRRLRSVHREISDFRESLAAILGAGGVRPFEVAVGTFLTPSHRSEIQVLGRKGWGTREYAPQPFQPGEVVAVVRPGYRIGEGEGAIVLRKAEVLIRGGGG
jgi:predicted  nucleic acid-binding Zn-ribbon protein